MMIAWKATVIVCLFLAIVVPCPEKEIMKTEDYLPDASEKEVKILHVPDWMVHDSPEMLYPWTTEEELQQVMNDFHVAVANKLARLQVESLIELEEEAEKLVRQEIV